MLISLIITMVGTEVMCQVPNDSVAMDASGTKILLDTPSAEPALGFERTALALSHVITESDPRFAIGIFGGWGSGKTTLMKAIQSTLPSDNVVVVEFNAWRFEREPHLLIPLIDTIQTALTTWSGSRDTTTKERVRGMTTRIGHVVRALAAGLSGQVGIPGAVTIGYDLGNAIDALSVDRGDSGQPRSLYLAAFMELTRVFEDFVHGGVTRIVIFVDDLDRCLPYNALDVLESIKLFFDLPGFVFVVGLDEGVVQRAVRARFADGSSAIPVPVKGGELVIGGARMPPTQELERNYVEKIFQVPYRLPPIMAGQLNDLLDSIYSEAGLPSVQLADFKERVAPHLAHVAVERQINPREVKRFLNTYTLQMLIRPELDRNVVLALQTLLFRYEWRLLYDAILADSLLFIDALTRYRSGEDSAFEDLSSELRVLPTELGEYLRSDLADALRLGDASQLHGSLDPYLSSLESTGAGVPWISDAYRDLGRLRGELRRFRALERADENRRKQLVRIAIDCSSRLGSIPAGLGTRGAQALEAVLDELRHKVEELQAWSPGASPSADTDRPNQIATEMYDISNRLYHELRTARDMIAPSPKLVGEVQSLATDAQ